MNIEEVNKILHTDPREIILIALSSEVSINIDNTTALNIVTQLHEQNLLEENVEIENGILLIHI